MTYFLLDIERTVLNNVATYWKQNRHGYVYGIDDAGRFSKETAEEIVAGDFNQLTIMISVEDVKKIFGY
jgi:hypothetical protein